MFRTRLWLASAVLAAFALAHAAHADTTPEGAKSLATLETMVTNLGYTTTDATDKSHFYIAWQGKYNYTVDFETSSDGLLVYTYIYIDTFSADQLAKMPFVKMMELQNLGNVYFSMQSTSKGEDLYTNSVFGTAGLTPAQLRSNLNYFIQKTDGSDTMWNTKLWK